MDKVLHLRCSGSLLGAETVILELASSSSDYGYESVVGVIHDSRDPYPELATTAEQRNLKYEVFPASHRIDIPCIKNIKRFVQRENIDIIHTHGYREDLYALLSRTGRQICATNHLWKRTNPILKLYALIDSIAMSQIDRIVAVSQPILTEMEASSFISNNKLSMISNGIDTEKFHPGNSSSVKSELNIKQDTLLITTVSSLTTEKGHKYLIEALAKLKPELPDFHTIIVGEGPERNNIARQIDELDLGSEVTLAGSRSDISDIHADSDIYILPSLKEGLPMSLLEAMASGVSAIATDVGDVSKCIRPDETGILVRPSDASELFYAIRNLASDAALRERLGNTAATLIQESFSTAAMSQKYCDLYDQMLSKGI